MVPFSNKIIKNIKKTNGIKGLINSVSLLKKKKKLIIKIRNKKRNFLQIIKLKLSLRMKKRTEQKNLIIKSIMRSNKFTIVKKKIKIPSVFIPNVMKKKTILSLLKKPTEKKKKYQINFEHSRSKKKHESWEKTKQRLKNERKIKFKRKRKNLKKLKQKKILKIKNEILKKTKIINKVNIKQIKKIFSKKAKIHFQRKKKHLQHSIFMKKKKKHKKLVFYVFKTKKWNIHLNNKTSKTFRNKRRTKKTGRQVKSNRIFYFIKNLQSGKWIRRRKKVFYLRETLKKFIKKINAGLPNNLKKYFSNPNKKKKKENLESFSNNFINNINILLYRIGVFPSISLSIEATKRNWFCINFENQNNQNNVIHIGDSITLFPSFEIYSNYIWTKQVFIKQIYSMSCNKQEFYVSKKPLLFFFIKIKKKNLIINNTPKDWIKIAYLRNLKLIP